MSEGEEAEETERKQEKLGLRGGRKAGPLRRGHGGFWRGRRGGTSDAGGPRRGCAGRNALARSVCTVMLGGHLNVATWVKSWASVRVHCEYMGGGMGHACRSAGQILGQR